MIEKLKTYSQHVQDEATVTADLLQEAATLLADAQKAIGELIDAYRQTLRANGYEPRSDACDAANKVRYRILGVTLP
ncbi:hypothetical protein EVB39_057 [Rhizobium phage RHph_TM3_3_9]|nr:hypothetical protein EVB39_057 [Rhizobium phage RHph_TM3_3_9]QIG68578.1 hypothetical protein EVB66_057 [Rhizobium phage RHph_TM3_3_13]QIG74436.1 hypothetical protein EVC09_056 [Rhizobium phage RHph_TM3_3_10]QXV74550.1 hypothetical protein [Rhizobium phage RHEph19]